MSRTVGPSQRVCSSPTFVSTTVSAPSTLVASWRPPRPASITATSTSRRASSSSAAAVTSSNCVTRSPSSSVRSTFAAAAAARCTAAPNASPLEVPVADPDPLGEARQVRRQERSGAHAVRLEQRGGHADGRGLAVRAHDVDRRVSAPAGCRARSAAAACGPGRTASRTARARAGASRRPPDANRSKLLQLPSEPFELGAFGVHDRRRRLAPRSPGWRACPRRARSPARACCGARGRARRRRRRRRCRTRARRCCRPGTPTVAIGAPPSADHSTRASRATCAAVCS